MRKQPDHGIPKRQSAIGPRIRGIFQCDTLLPRTLLKKVQMQGGRPKAERGVLEVRRSECRAKPTPQMGLFSGLLNQ